MTKMCERRKAHLAKLPVEKLPTDCRICKTKGGINGHYFKECPEAVYSPDGHQCFKCAGKGHTIRSCTAPSNVKCTQCGLFGHCNAMHNKVMEWRKSRGYEDKVCPRCEKKGHIKLECPMQARRAEEKEEKVCYCYKCDKQGHVMKDCVGSPATHALQNKTCHKCKEKGHLAKACPVARREWLKTVECYRCKQKGHVKVDCPQRLQEEGSRLVAPPLMPKWNHQRNKIG